MSTISKVALAVILLPGCIAATVHGEIDRPEDTIRAFYRAVYGNDPEAFKALTVDHRERNQLLGKRRITGEELKELDRTVAGMSLEQLQSASFKGKPISPDIEGRYPEGARVRYLAVFRGIPMVVTAVREKEGWKVDLRWWLEMRRMATEDGPRPPLPGTPEFAAKALLSTLLTLNREDVAKFLIPGSDVSVIFEGAPAEPEPSDHYIALALEMPLVEVGPGEFYKLPSGEVVEGSAKSAKEHLFVGIFANQELPFVMRKIGSEWKIVPQPYFRVLGH